jgi:uncharacterized membrane protein YdjX (TVP38/TMEM64 family)
MSVSVMSGSVTPTMQRWRKFLLLFLGAALVLLFAFGRQLHTRERLQEALGWIANSGWAGMLVFVCLYVVACVLLLPGSVLTFGAGTVFGLVKGMVLSSVAATLGATAAFLVGRYLARDWVARRLERFPHFQAIDEAVAADGWKVVGLTRLSPLLPFSLLNYAYGLTRISLRDYVVASWIGMLPGAALYSYLGSLVHDLTAGNTRRERTPVEWVFYGVGLLATVVVSWWLTRLCRKTLAKRTAATEPTRNF